MQVRKISYISPNILAGKKLKFETLAKVWEKKQGAFQISIFCAKSNFQGVYKDARKNKGNALKIAFRRQNAFSLQKVRNG